MKKYVYPETPGPEIKDILEGMGVAVDDDLPRYMLIRLAEQYRVFRGKNTAVPESYKREYGAEASCNDDVAVVIRQFIDDHDLGVVEAVNIIKADNGIPLSRWGNLNPGMQRMNLGNTLRGKIRNGFYVRVGSTEWNRDMKSSRAG